MKKLADTFDVAKTLMKGTESILKTVSSPEELEMYSRDAIFTNSKAKELLKYAPITTVQEGINSTVTWLKKIKFYKRIFPELLSFHTSIEYPIDRFPTKTGTPAMV